MQASAEGLFDRMTAAVGRNLPPGVSPSSFEAFVQHRPTLIAVLNQHLQKRNRSGSPPSDAPDLWSPSSARRPTSAPSESPRASAPTK